MKKFYYFLFSLLVIGGSALAGPKISEENINYRYGDSFIFVEGGIEFAVYPDGQFDFFYNSRGNGYNVNVVSPGMNMSYNAGYNYDPYVQYDDFGAVIQIEHVPVFYDYYGRIIQAGNIYITYNQFGRVARIGGLHLYYNPYNQFTHYTGYINSYNRFYVAKPWHYHYMRPNPQFAVVYHQPYRAFYTPSRVTYNYHVNYYNTYYNNGGYKKSYYRPGQQATSYHRGHRTDQERDLRPQRFNSDYSVATRGDDDRREIRSNSTVERSRTRASVNKSRSATSANEVSRNRIRESRGNVQEDYNLKQSRAVQQRQSAVQQRVVQQRTNTRNTGYTRSRETTVNTPAVRMNNRAAIQAPVRESRTSTPAARTSSRTGTVQPERVSTPQPLIRSEAGSTRGRRQ